MMKTAFLYAGQGSQHCGMGRDLYEEFPAFRETWARADEGGVWESACFEGEEETLQRTEITQPCMVLFAAGITEVLRREGITPALAAGLSLGEISALFCAGVFDAPGAVKFAAYRGRVMEETARGIPCAMKAVLGLAEETLRKICRDASAIGVAEIANLNCPGQIVISGEEKAIEEAARRALEAGARRCIPLKVSGPFHTSLMRPAGALLEGWLSGFPLKAERLPVVFNATARTRGETETVAGLLAKQVCSAVRMEETLRLMQAKGIEKIIEIGPGRALSGFCRRTIPEIPVISIETAQELRDAIRELKGESL